jgi:hypothetical protein
MVEDARFCHRCGRPLNGIDPAPEETAESAEPVAAAQSEPPVVHVVTAPFEQPLQISFRNGLAVRVCLVAAGLSLVLLLAAGAMGPSALNVVFLSGIAVFGGFYAVWIYGRRSGQFLDVRSGARLGWMTGIFSFVLNTILFTLTMLALSDKGGLAQLYRESANKMGLPKEALEKAVATLQDPNMVAMILVVSLLTMFLVYTVASSLGGALGAKLLDRR